LYRPFFKNLKHEGRSLHDDEIFDYLYNFAGQEGSKKAKIAFKRLVTARIESALIKDFLSGRL
jgi:hypothetical protein